MPDSENPILFLEESLRDKLGDEFLSSYEAASRRGGENSLLVDDNRGQKGPSCCAADVAAQAQADLSARELASDCWPCKLNGVLSRLSIPFFFGGIEWKGIPFPHGSIPKGKDSPPGRHVRPLPILPRPEF